MDHSVSHSPSQHYIIIIHSDVCLLPLSNLFNALIKASILLVLESSFMLDYVWSSMLSYSFTLILSLHITVIGVLQSGLWGEMPLRVQCIMYNIAYYVYPHILFIKIHKPYPINLVLWVEIFQTINLLELQMIFHG